MANKELKTVGWREAIDIPAWDIEGLVAKMDTGARSSCLDARGMEVIDAEGHGDVRFTLPIEDGDIERQETIQDWRFVRDSGGHAGLRPVIELGLRLDGHVWTDLVTLQDRSDMRHRILVGRRILSGRFVVDPSKRFLITDLP